MFRRRNRGHELQHPEIKPYDAVQEAKLELADAIDSLRHIDHAEQYMPFAGDVALERVFRSIHRFATVAGIAEDNTEARLDLALAVDAQLKYGSVPNPFRTFCDAKDPDFVRGMARPVMVEVTLEEQRLFFDAQPERIVREEGYVAPGYDELANLSQIQDVPNPFWD